jgi:PadR family transcriptional regulator, regulatory protein PadR
MSTHRDLYAGLIRLHVLHHAAADGEIFGLAIIRELRHHGYETSPGTIYPILHGLERRKYLRSSHRQVQGHRRRVYRITPTGRQALADLRGKVRELFTELIQEPQ